MPDLQLSVTICSWNTQEDLRLCLQSLRDVRDEAAFEVIVVDNNSEDGSPEMVRIEFPEVRLEAMDRNLGFCAGHNHAVAIMRGEHAFLLNSDASVHTGCIANLLLAANDNPQAAVIGPKILNPDGSLQLSCRRFPNPVAAMFRNTPLGRLFPNNRFTRSYLMEDWNHAIQSDVDWVSGAACLVRGDFIKAHGLFDEAFFMFCEDVDLCWRAWKSGAKVLYAPSAVVTHAIGKSTDKAPNRMIARFHKSMFRFFVKNQLPEWHPFARHFGMLMAATGLTIRASLFLIKNKCDVLRRKLKR